MVFLLLGKIIICGNLHDHFKNWLLLNHAGLTYYFINWLLFDCAGLTKEELQESTEVNSFELWIIQFSFETHLMKNFTRADAHNMYYWAFSWHISFSIIHSGDLLYDGLHMVRHLQVLQVIMLAIQATDGQMDSSDSDFFRKKI